jgi:hypothetical protein
MRWPSGTVTSFLHRGQLQRLGQAGQRRPADHEDALGHAVGHLGELVVEAFEHAVQLVEAPALHAPVVVVQLLVHDDAVGEDPVQAVDHVLVAHGVHSLLAGVALGGG